MEGVAVRAGHHCAQPLLKYLKFSDCSCQLLSLQHNEDADRLVEALMQQRSFSNMALSKLDNLYRQVILDHSSHPHHRGTLTDSTTRSN